MKLNFWQWLGLIVLVIALIFIIRRETAPTKTALPSPSNPPATQPVQ